MPWKKDDDGNLVIAESGDPVFVYPDGNEAPFNGDNQYSKIGELNRKLSKRQKRISQYESTIKLFSDAGVDTSSADEISDFITTAKKNAETVDNFDDSQFVKADEIEKIKGKAVEKFKSQMEKQRKAYEAKLASASEALGQKDKLLHQNVIKNAFLGSEFVRNKTSFPHPEIAYDYLKKRFKVENGDDGIRGIGLDTDGDPLHSVKDPAKVADLPEAIEIVIKTHPQRDSLLIADGGGSGGGGDHKKRRSGGSTTAISSKDKKAFSRNLEKIAKGEIEVNYER